MITSPSHGLSHTLSNIMISPTHGLSETSIKTRSKKQPFNVDCGKFSLDKDQVNNIFFNIEGKEIKHLFNHEFRMAFPKNFQALLHQTWKPDHQQRTALCIYFLLLQRVQGCVQHQRSEKRRKFRVQNFSLNL